jgi:hypothetical protein
MKSLSQSLAVLLGEASLAACLVYNTSLPGVTWDDDSWTLISTTANNADWYSQSFVSNGYIGASFASTGPFPYTYSVTGGPYFDTHVTFGTVAGFFDRQPKTSFAAEPWLQQYGWESVIAGIPAWGAIVVDLGNGVYLDGSVDESQLSNIVLKQNYKNGYAQYSYTWTPAGGTPLDVSYLVFADKGYPSRAHVQLSLSAASATEVTIVNLIDGTTAVRSDPSGSGNDGRYIYSGVKPTGVSNITAWIYSTIDGPGVNETTLDQITGQPYITNNPSTVAVGAKISLVPGQAVNITKYVGIASTDAFPYPDVQAFNESINALAAGFESAFEAHVQEWDTVLPQTAVTCGSHHRRHPRCLGRTADSYRRGSRGAAPSHRQRQRCLASRRRRHRHLWLGSVWSTLGLLWRPAVLGPGHLDGPVHVRDEPGGGQTDHAVSRCVLCPVTGQHSDDIRGLEGGRILLVWRGQLRLVNGARWQLHGFCAVLGLRIPY